MPRRRGGEMAWRNPSSVWGKSLAREQACKAVVDVWWVVLKRIDGWGTVRSLPEGGGIWCEGRQATEAARKLDPQRQRTKAIRRFAPRRGERVVVKAGVDAHGCGWVDGRALAFLIQALPRRRTWPVWNRGRDLAPELPKRYEEMTGTLWLPEHQHPESYVTPATDADVDPARAGPDD